MEFLCDHVPIVRVNIINSYYVEMTFDHDNKQFHNHIYVVENRSVHEHQMHA